MSTMTVSSALALEHIHKSYGEKVVLSDASVSFEPGTITALVGPNGAGKTTLLRIAAALQFPDSGAVTGQRAGYFGGFETMPVKGTVDGLFSALGLDVAKGDRRRLSSLSRGELQWIGVDALFALGCRSVLLDEPWTGLEPDRREDLSRRMAEEASRGTAVVCASHDLDEVDRVAQRIYFIGKGKVVEVQERNDAGRELLLRMFREAKPAR